MFSLVVPAGIFSYEAGGRNEPGRQTQEAVYDVGCGEKRGMYVQAE